MSKQSSGVVKHRPLNSHVAWLERPALVILFSTGLDLLSVVHRGWALLGIATGVLVGCLDWFPWAGTVGNDWPSVGWGPWSFSGEAAVSRACKVTGASLQLKVMSCRMALCSCRDVCGFCGGFSHLLSSLYRIAHLLVLLFLLWTMSGPCHGEVALFWLSCLSPMARALWRWVVS